MELTLDLIPFDKPPFFPGWMKENPKGKETDIFSSTMNQQLDEIMGVVQQLGNFLEQNTVLQNDCICDLLGNLFEVDRKQRTNENFVKSIQAKVLENTAKGTVESLLKILRFVYSNEEGSNFRLKPNYPAGVKIMYNDESEENEPLDKFAPYMVGAGISYKIYPGWSEIILEDKASVGESHKERYYFLDEIHYDKIRNIVPADEKEFPYSGIVQHGAMEEARTDNKIGVSETMRYQFFPLIKYNGDKKYDGSFKYNAGWEDEE
jgi:hypothetical protein